MTKAKVERPQSPERPQMRDVERGHVREHERRDLQLDDGMRIRHIGHRRRQPSGGERPHRSRSTSTGARPPPAARPAYESRGTTSFARMSICFGSAMVGPMQRYVQPASTSPRRVSMISPVVPKR